MKRETGLWIDHRQAVIVTRIGRVEEIRRITSHVEKPVHAPDAAEGLHDDTSGVRRNNASNTSLSRYYSEVIANLYDADSILIFGPDEAKGELRKQLEGQALGKRIVATITADNMTVDQVVTAVRQRIRDSHRITQQPWLVPEP
jgi:hypothetical protein